MRKLKKNPSSFSNFCCALFLPLILPLFALTFFVGCEIPKGSFEAYDSLTFKKRIRISTGSKINVPRGTYGAKISLHTTTKILELDLDTIDTIRFRLPNANLISLHSPGTQYIDLRADQIEQAYDIRGAVDITQRNSGQHFERESCVLDTYYDYRGVLRTVYGLRDVEYHFVYTDRTYTLDLFRENAQNSIGTFRGNSSDSHKVFDYQGPCY